jgi:metal-responsive CopG/Arc/MetJ family transcriptional regulator
MDRFTISLDANLATAFDALIAERGCANRSEAGRDILRNHLQQSAQKGDTKGSCVANLSYVHNHHAREDVLDNITLYWLTNTGIPLLVSIGRTGFRSSISRI